MKRIAMCCMAALTIFVMTSFVYAQEPLSIHLENFKTTEDRLTLLFNSPADQELTAEQLTVTVSGQSVPVTGLDRFDSSENGTTFLFLADVSGSITGTDLTP